MEDNHIYLSDNLGEYMSSYLGRVYKLPMKFIQWYNKNILKCEYTEFDSILQATLTIINIYSKIIRPYNNWSMLEPSYLAEEIFNEAQLVYNINNIDKIKEDLSKSTLSKNDKYTLLKTFNDNEFIQMFRGCIDISTVIDFLKENFILNLEKFNNDPAFPIENIDSFYIENLFELRKSHMPPMFCESAKKYNIDIIDIDNRVKELFLYKEQYDQLTIIAQGLNKHISYFIPETVKIKFISEENEKELLTRFI